MLLHKVLVAFLLLGFSHQTSFGEARSIIISYSNLGDVIGIENGKLYGWQANLVNCAIQKLPLDTQILLSPTPARLMMKLKSGKAHMGIYLSRTEERNKEADFSKEVIGSLSVSEYLPREKESTRMEQSTGIRLSSNYKKIALERGYEIVSVRTIKQLVRMLMLDRISAVVEADILFEAELEKLNIDPQSFKKTLLREDIVGAYFSRKLPSGLKKLPEMWDQSLLKCRTKLGEKK